MWRGWGMCRERAEVGLCPAGKLTTSGQGMGREARLCVALDGG